jgi:phage shock protein A
MFSSKKEFNAVEKEIIELKEAISDISSIIDKHNSNINLKLDKQEERIAIIQESLSKMQEKTSLFGEKLEDEAKKFAELNDSFRKRIESLKILEDKVGKKLLDDAASEIRSQVQSLFTTTKEYQKLESELKQLGVSVSSLRPELDKLRQIAGNLRPADFIMSEYAKKVTQADHEKLSLMRENERLKMIISKERRNSNFKK